MAEQAQKKFQLLMLDIDPRTGERRTRPVAEVFREDAELLGGKTATIMNTMAKFVETYESGWNKVYGTRLGKKVLNKIGEKMRQKGLDIVPPAKISEEEKQVTEYRKEKAKSRRNGLME